MKLFNKQVVN